MSGRGDKEAGVELGAMAANASFSTSADDPRGTTDEPSTTSSVSLSRSSTGPRSEPSAGTQSTQPWEDGAVEPSPPTPYDGERGWGVSVSGDPGERVLFPPKAHGAESKAAEETTYETSPRRWYILAVLVLLQVSNAMLWICYAPIATTVKKHYGDRDPDWFSQVFMIVSIPLSVVAMWGVDRFGLRTGVWLGASANLLGAVVKLLASLPSLSPAASYPLALLGQCIAASAQPFVMFMPTKLAGQWFPQSQRAIANTLGSMANPLGIMLAMLVAPKIVGSDPSKVLLLNGLMVAPAGVAAVMGFGGVWSSLPPSPPSASASSGPSLGFKENLRLCWRQRSFWVLVVTLGGGVGVFNAVYTLLQQVLCVKGYSEDTAGLSGALLIVGGLLGSAATGVFVDWSKRFQETAKLCYLVAAAFAVGLAVLLLHSDQRPAILALFFFFGFFGFAIYPIGLEMGVEVTYPAAEATSSGLVIISGQVQGILFLVAMQLLGGVEAASEEDREGQACGLTAAQLAAGELPNWRPATIFMASVAGGLAVAMAALFWPVYRRLMAEREAADRTLPPAAASTPPAHV